MCTFPTSRNPLLSILYMAVILFSLPAYAAFSADELKAIQLIKQDLLPFTKTLSRAVRTYHWNNLPDVQQTLRNSIQADDVTLKDPRIIKFANQWRDGFWLDRGTQGDVGWGLYTASTPLSSMAWRCFNWLNESGCGDWILLELTLAAQSKFLDLRWGNKRGWIKFSEATLNYLNQKMGCQLVAEPQGRRGEKPYHALGKTIISQSLCSKYFSAAVKELNLAFLVYQWFPQTPSGCDLPAGKVGFVIIGAPVDASTTTIFSSKVRIPSAEAPEYARLKAYLDKDGEGGKLSSTLNTGTAKPTHMAQSLFYCKRKDGFSEDLPFE